jgi:flavin reductase (DIM6/NTAB) family NADH-FMN oxidoreductase RutF
MLNKKKTVKKPIAKTPVRRRIAPKIVHEKAAWQPGTVMWPLPAVMVSCATEEGKANILTIAWTGVVCSEPPMLSISVRPHRYSHKFIAESRQFVVNIPSAAQLRTLDSCGIVSGRNVDKFKQYGLTPAPGLKVKAPIIAECPLNIECVVRKTLELGTHTMFVAQIVAVQVSKEMLTPNGRLAIEKMGLFAFAHGEYFAIGQKLGYFGFSVRKKGARKR